jgi:hypothetical protein
MAFITQVWSAFFSFRDNNNNTAGCGVDYPGDLTEAEVTLAATSLATDLQAASNAALEVMVLTRRLINDAPPVPTPESEVERKLRFNLGTALRRNVSSIEVPSPVFTIEQAGTDAVDPANALVAALISELTAGILLPGNGPITYYGEDITRAEAPVIVHRTRKPRT